MKQLRLWALKEEVVNKIEMEQSVREKVTALMSEAIVAVVQAEEEVSDEHVEES